LYLKNKSRRRGFADSEEEESASERRKRGAF